MSLKLKLLKINVNHSSIYKCITNIYIYIKYNNTLLIPKGF